MGDRRDGGRGGAPGAGPGSAFTGRSKGSDAANRDASHRGKWNHAFLGTKSWNVLSRNNQEKVRAAEERVETEARQRRQAAAEFAREQRKFREAAGGDAAKQSALSVSFMYAKPPGLAEAEEREGEKREERKAGKGEQRNGEQRAPPRATLPGNVAAGVPGAKFVAPKPRVRRPPTGQVGRRAHGYVHQRPVSTSAELELKRTDWQPSGADRYDIVGAGSDEEEEGGPPGPAPGPAGAEAGAEARGRAAGRGEGGKTSIQDFEAAAEFLLARGVDVKAELAARLKGRSSGGKKHKQRHKTHRSRRRDR